MQKKIKSIFFVSVLLTLLFAVTAVSAADVSNDTTSLDDSTSKLNIDKTVTNDNTVTDTITKDSKNIKTTYQDHQVNDDDFDANDTHGESSASAMIEVLGDSVVNITSDNFYTYFNKNGELNASHVSSDMVFYFYSLPDNATQISIVSTGENFSECAIIFAGTENFTLYNKAVIISSNPKEFHLVNMTVVYDNDYGLDDYILLDAWEQTQNCIIDNCNITANISRPTPEGTTFSLLVTSGANPRVINSNITVYTVESEVDWGPGSDTYGNNNIIPIYVKSRTELLNNTFNIIADVDGSNYPTMYAIRLGARNTLMSGNNITINGGGWLYAIQPTTSNITISDNNIDITGVNYTAGIMMENVSNATIDNNTIVLRAATSREGMLNEPCTYGITIIDYRYTGGTVTETGNAANNKITNNNINCTAINMYGIEEFGGSNTIIENNTMVATGDTAMAIGVLGSNILINNNNITVIGDSFSGNTVDYLGARTTGVYVGRGINATITNNNINSTFTGIYTQAQRGANIENNNITTTNYTHTILIDKTTNNTNIENNYLITNDLTGDDSVNNTGNNNIVQNNLPANELINTQIQLQVQGPSTMNIGEQKSIYGYFALQGAYTGTYVDLITVYDNGEQIATVGPTDNWGTISLQYNATVVGEHNITFEYAGNDSYLPCESSVILTVVEPPKPTLKVDTSEFTVGTNATIQASIYLGDNIISDINTGKVVFKVNGKTLKDANGKVIYAKIVNGTATIENYEIPESWAKDNVTIEATLTGCSETGTLKTDKTPITITTPEPTITTNNITTTTGSTITLTANINSDTEVIGKVVFKINSKTVKDENGKVIYAQVVNNTVSIEYTLPESLKAGNYNITAVFTGKNGKLEDTKTLTVTD